MRFKYQGHILRPIEGTGPSPEPPTPSFDQVQIGNQIWMSKNLAIDDGGEGISTKTVNYGQGDVVEYYYTWAAAVRVAESVQGWHLPTSSELDALVSYVGGTSVAGTKLKSTYGWANNGNGTDEFGFTALPAGYYDTSHGMFGEYAYFWSSTSHTYDESLAYRGALSYGKKVRVDSTYKTQAGSVRLIKDS